MTNLSIRDTQNSWWLGNGKCNKHNFDYWHVTLEHGDVQKSYLQVYCDCHGCKNVYNERAHVAEHQVEQTNLFLCRTVIVRYKREAFLNPGWSLLDQNGYLRKDILMDKLNKKRKN